MMRLCVCILVAVILTVIATGAAEECDADQLEVFLTSVNPNTYKVVIGLENRKKDDICVLKWDTPLDPQHWPISVIVEEEDSGQWRELPYDYPVLPVHLDISPSDYKRIESEQKVLYSRDLSDYFSFTEDRDYRVTVKTSVGDCYKHLPGPCTKAISKESDLVRIAVTNNEVSTTFTAKKTISRYNIKVSFELWLASISDDYPVLQRGKITTIGASQDKMNTIETAHTKAFQYIAKAVDLLKSQHKDKMLIYRDWFADEQYYDIVLKLFEDILEEGEKSHVYVLPTHGEKLCRTVEAAYVPKQLAGKRQHFIYICPLFFSPSKNLKDQALTLVHEMTHDTGNTEDFAYTEIDCQQLPSQKAIKNAENYAYYAESAYDTL